MPGLNYFYSTYISLLLLIFCLSHAQAQQTASVYQVKIDSLQTLLKQQPKDDTTKVKRLNYQAQWSYADQKQQKENPRPGLKYSANPYLEKFKAELLVALNYFEKHPDSNREILANLLIAYVGFNKRHEQTFFVNKAIRQFRENNQTTPLYKEDRKRDEGLENELLDDLAQNQERINHCGKRAGSIVKGLLEHSRTGTGERVPTDSNKLADEYLRLSYHGMRDKDNSFQADFELTKGRGGTLTAESTEDEGTEFIITFPKTI